MKIEKRCFFSVFLVFSASACYSSRIIKKAGHEVPDRARPGERRRGGNNLKHQQLIPAAEHRRAGGMRDIVIMISMKRSLVLGAGTAAETPSDR